MINRNINIEPTIEELASEFCRMNDSQQAEFFNAIGRIVENEWSAPFCFQLEAIRQSEELKEEGRGILNEIAQYFSE